jgi:hypothetical protein
MILSSITREGDDSKKVNQFDQNKRQSSKQIHFLICQTCFWCASLLYQIRDPTTAISRSHICNEKRLRSYASLVN